MFTIPSDDGQFELPAYWVLPPDFDPKNTKKQYPVIFSIYGGPDSGTVRNALAGRCRRTTGPSAVSSSSESTTGAAGTSARRAWR